MHLQNENLNNQNVAWQSQNDSLQLEIENMHLQNENLKNIIEIGKSTVETAKKISQDLSEENNLLKQKEKDDLQVVQKNEELKRIKFENQSLVGKCKELQEKLNIQMADYTKLQESFNLKSTEVGNLYSQITAKSRDDRNDKNLKGISGIKSLKDDTRSKLIKCREKCRGLEESKKSLENDKKALILENRNAANEIKTLKNHLSSNRAIVVEKAVTKDEINNLKSELTSKCVEIEKSSIKLKKLSTELNCVLGELKVAKESKNLVDKELLVLKEKMKGVETDDVAAKLTFNEVEYSTLKSENEALKEAKKELDDRLEFYINQCSTFEKNDAQLQEEISLLQSSIKDSTIENSSELNSLRDTVESLENSVIFYKDQEGVLVEDNEKLKAELANLKSQPVVNVNEDFLTKYNLKCDMVEELIKKHEKIAAQLRRKDWEIENYQKKLDSAFEAELLHNFPESSTGNSGTSVGNMGSRSPEVLALDLSTREVSGPVAEDVRVIPQDVAEVVGFSDVVGTGSDQTFNESSAGFHSHQVSPATTLNASNAISFNENLDASFDSTSTCPSEAANVSIASNGTNGRKRSVSVGHGLPPKKIPYVRLEDG